jgi:acetyl-CoA carboxylase alpha subunit
MVRSAVKEGGRERAPILVFLFCRGHAHEIGQERAGLHVALAECMKSLVVAGLAGHPLLCILGGGAYGAAYLSLAAPCHRVLAIRGTTVAPMAPRVLAAFRQLKGAREGPETPQDLARLIPEIRIVESVVALPRVLREEVTCARRDVRARVDPGERLRAE